MKISRMDEIFVERGFEVNKRYISDTKEYEFVITRDNVTVSGTYKFMDIDDMRLVDEMQHNFIEGLIGDWRLKLRMNTSYNDVNKKYDVKYVPYGCRDGKSTVNLYKHVLNAIYGEKRFFTPQIENVIFNDPATIVFWADGTKTVVKAENEPYDPEKGLAMAISKKALGNKYDYYNVFKKWLKRAPKKDASDV